MTRLNELLNAADPCAHESPPSDSARARLRTSALTASRTPTGVAGRRSAVRVAIAAVGLLALAAVLSSTRLWTAIDAPAYAAVRFEVRLAEAAPAPGLREAPVGAEPVLVYVHDQAIVSNDEIVSCRVVPAAAADRYDIEVVLSPSGAARLRDATRDHVGRPVALMVDGLVVMAPTVRSEIGQVGRITGSFAKQEAERLARGMVPQ